MTATYTMGARSKFSMALLDGERVFDYVYDRGDKLVLRRRAGRRRPGGRASPIRASSRGHGAVLRMPSVPFPFSNWSFS